MRSLQLLCTQCNSSLLGVLYKDLACLLSSELSLHRAAYHTTPDLANLLAFTAVIKHNSSPQPACHHYRGYHWNIQTAGLTWQPTHSLLCTNREVRTSLPVTLASAKPKESCDHHFLCCKVRPIKDGYGILGSLLYLLLIYSGNSLGLS